MNELVGNVDVEDHHLIIATGSTQLIHAALFGIAKANGPLVVRQQAPYYTAHAECAKYFNTSLLSWSEEDFVSPCSHDTIEIVTSLNNSDGSLLTAQCTGALQVYDNAYFWPHFMPLTSRRSDDVILFTLSKLTGHAGSRVGWAFVRDADIAASMGDHGRVR